MRAKILKKIIRIDFWHFSWQHWQIFKILQIWVFVKYFKVPSSEQRKKANFIFYGYTAYFLEGISLVSLTEKKYYIKIFFQHLTDFFFVWAFIFHIFVYYISYKSIDKGFLLIIIWSLAYNTPIFWDLENSIIFLIYFYFLINPHYLHKKSSLFHINKVTLIYMFCVK